MTTEDDLGVEWGHGSFSGPSDRLSDPDSAGEEDAMASPPAPRSDDPALRRQPRADANASSQTRIDRLRAAEMQRNVDEAIELAGKMLELGLVPKSVKVGTTEIHFAGYEKPREPVEPTDAQSAAPRPNRYEAARSRMTKGTR